MVTKCHEKFNGKHRTSDVVSLLSTGIASAEKTSHRDTERDHENY